MAEILGNYPIEEILIIIIATTAFIYGIYKAYIYLDKRFDDAAERRIFTNNLPTIIEEIQDNNRKQDKQIELLIKSDRSRIKGELNRECQRFTQQGHIDYRSWDYLHQQFDIYLEEEGNSWAGEVMHEIDQIPRDW